MLVQEQIMTLFGMKVVPGEGSGHTYGELTWEDGNAVLQGYQNWQNGDPPISQPDICFGLSKGNLKQVVNWSIDMQT